MDLDTVSEWSVDDDLYSIYSNQGKYKDLPRSVLKNKTKYDKYRYTHEEPEDFDEEDLISSDNVNRRLRYLEFMRREQLKEMEKIERRLAELTRARQEFKLLQKLNARRERYPMDVLGERKRYREYATPAMSEISEFSDFPELSEIQKRQEHYWKQYQKYSKLLNYVQHLKAKKAKDTKRDL